MLHRIFLIPAERDCTMCTPSIIIMGPKLKNLESLLERMQYTTLNDKITAMKRKMTITCSRDNLHKGKCPNL